MNKLIEKDDCGNWSLKGVRWSNLMPGALTTKDTYEKVYAALWKLMEYEETDHTPTMIRDIERFAKKEHKRAMEYAIQIDEMPHWIPVSKRLPECEQEVWISTKTDCIRRGTYTKKYGFSQREGFICDDGFMYMNTANAWMPYFVPEPYKPEEVGQ